MIPDVTFYTGFIKQYENKSNDFALGVSAPVPVWNRNQGNIRAAQAELGSSIQEVARVENELADIFATAFRTFDAAQRRAELYRTSILPKLQEAAELSRKAFQGGQFDILRLALAQRAFIEARVEYVKVLAEAWKAAAELSGLLLEESWPEAPREIPGVLPHTVSPMAAHDPPNPTDRQTRPLNHHPCRRPRLTCPSPAAIITLNRGEREMVVRLLVVVLTLIGAVPIRICTCGAASDPAPVTHSAPSPCSHRHGPIDGPSIGGDSGHAHHDADCHAVKPRPLMSIGLSCDVIDAPAADGLIVPLVEAPALQPAAVHAIRDTHPPPAHPSFLSYTVLRN